MEMKVGPVAVSALDYSAMETCDIISNLILTAPMTTVRFQCEGKTLGKGILLISANNSIKYPLVICEVKINSIGE